MPTCKALICSLHKDSNKNQVQDHPLHQHPHEGHQEEVVEEDSDNLAINRDMVISQLINTSHECELSYPEADTQVDMNVVAHVA